MYTKLKFVIPLLVLMVGSLAACNRKMKFVAPEIDPPTDLIPGYVPKGFELISGFQLSSDNMLPEFAAGNEIGLLGPLIRINHFFNLKSPARNDIQGTYYQGEENLILITKSYFPNGSLDEWLAVYEKGQSKPVDCKCAGIPRLDTVPFPIRFDEFQEVRTIDSTRLAILKTALGWTTVFVRGDYLLTIESGISLEENLKIVTSLLK
jgi:hypothetical protein